MWIYILIGVIVLLLIYVLVVYNKFIRLNNMVNEAFSTMDVYLKKRWDLIPNIVEVVKGYAAHEKSLFEEITKLRTAYMENKSLSDASVLDGKLNSLIAVAESYPELKASDNFLNLQKNLTKMEDQLQAARRLYNTDVTTYNTALQTFPSNMIAGLFGFKAEELFQLEPGKEGPVKVEL